MIKTKMKTRMRTRMKNNNIIWVSALLLVLIFGLIWADSRGFFTNGGQVIRTDTVMVSDTLYLRDTVTVSHPVPYVVTKVKTDTVYDHSGNEVQLITETKKYEENIIQDHDTATVKAQITGINAELDTISVMFNRRTVTNTVEITKYIEKKRKLLDRFKISPNVSAGYGIINRNLDVYIGVGVAFEL